ncbi:hypothetical protein ASD28_13580 [Massilia sp. Root133]|uniref:hypothetical protein n=1 Tax=unclassified Massilia TaxID=2609279 RepID=UPI0006F387F4|nr:MULTISPECIES: hypothetical protein [unclassified Massilia]KQY00337.1 hypothetical protein ASD28_13580 [Massilia sp. Root133]KQZ38954.1 hypothetical protein ASD92_03535 [Massilia sp. Root1485]
MILSNHKKHNKIFLKLFLLNKERQHRIREQIREEAKARRQIERALKDAAEEENTLQKAIAKVQA